MHINYLHNWITKSASKYIPTHIYTNTNITDNISLKHNKNWFFKSNNSQNTTNFLRSKQVPENIIDFVITQPFDQMKKMVSILAKNPFTDIEQLQNMVISKETAQPYLPEEIKRSNLIPDDEFKKWLLIQLRKMRKALPENQSPPIVYLFKDPYKNFSLPQLHELNTYINEIYDWYSRCLKPAIIAVKNAKTPEERAVILSEYAISNPNTQLASLTFEQANIESINWHKTVSNQGEGLAYYQEKLNDIIYGPQWKNPEYQGWTIKQIKTENNLKAEGNKMGHCVGSYYTDLLKGRTRIFSLRDPSNVPYVTMEVKPMSWTFTQIFGNGPKTGNTEPSDKLKSILREWIQTLPNAKLELY